MLRTFHVKFQLGSSCRVLGLHAEVIGLVVADASGEQGVQYLDELIGDGSKRSAVGLTLCTESVVEFVSPPRPNHSRLGGQVKRSSQGTVAGMSEVHCSVLAALYRHRAGAREGLEGFHGRETGDLSADL